MNKLIIIISLLVILTLIIKIIPRNTTSSFQNEGFYGGFDQTLVPKDQPDTLNWDFQSPKSNIKNFNETTQLHQDLNQIKGNKSTLIGLNQPFPNWIYPYTYINRRFDHILLKLVTQLEKDHNNNHLLTETPNEEWLADYPYQETTWELVPYVLQFITVDVIKELNRRFNTDPDIVGFRKQRLKYYWRSRDQALIIINVFKRYTANGDVVYEEDLLNPGINDHHKDNFERKLLIYADQINDEKGQINYHLRYLRFPNIDYTNENPIEDMRYIKSFDDYFYLGRSKDPLYRMLTNNEARQLYIQYLNKKPDVYKCFPRYAKGTKDLSRTTDQTSCELANGIWEKQCQKDTDCPYFQANKNYPNNYGGCNIATGYCKWPVGINPKTYRKPDNPEQAQCYNCEDGSLGKATAGACCKEQENTRKYVNLVTPDYKFEDDMEARFYYRRLFDKYKINWSPYT